jgi:zinc protease
MMSPKLYLKRMAGILLLSFLYVAAVAQLNKPYEMTIRGVKVIVQPSGNEIIEIRTVIKGGVQNYSVDKQGIESLAMNALTECGTEKDDKNSFKNKLDKVSAIINGGTGLDYASFSLNCIKGDFETVWPLYVDALTIPKFDEKEFERVKQDAINSLKAQASDPDYSIGNFARQTAFAGKNYAKLPEGSEATVSKLTASETKTYYKKILTRSRMLIVVVGEVDRADLEKKINSLLASIPAGSPVIIKKEAYTPTANTFRLEKKDFATNYLQAIGSAPLPGSKDYNAFVLAMRIFFDRHFLEVRTNNGLSYAPGSYLQPGLSPTSNISVSTTDPNKYIGVVDKLISTTRKEGFKEDEVKDMKNGYITSYYYRLETNDAQASSLASNEVLHNNWRRSITLNEDMKAITAADVSKAFTKYLTNLTWVYQGDPGKVDSKLYLKNIEVKRTLPPSKISDKKIN